MHSSKQNIQILTASLLSYNIRHIVLSPGSRNAPIIQTFSVNENFICHQVTDERSASFFALGIIDALQEPVAICCTSGTALLEYGAAIAEAYYRKLPLIILSADRSLAWLGQMDGQTIPQNNFFTNLTCKSITLLEPHTDEDCWYCQRMMHEAMLAIKQFHQPVHINIPLSEPLFDFESINLPHIHPIDFILPEKKGYLLDLENCFDIWKNSQKRMIIVGQQCFGENIKSITTLLKSLTSHHQCIILSEHLGNISDIEENISTDFDSRIYKLQNEKGNQKEYFLEKASPDLVIYIGGHIVSKRLKQFIREHKPSHLWRVDTDGTFSDVFQHITKFIALSPLYFLQFFCINKESVLPCNKSFSDFWLQDRNNFIPRLDSLEYSDLLAIGLFFDKLSSHSSLLNLNAVYLSNSSVVRNAQLFPLTKHTTIYCNRGTNGIDGIISTASGFVTVQEKTTFLIIGDLSFFYDIGFLAEEKELANLKILLINNGGGAIFDQLPMPKNNITYKKNITVTNSRNAKDWISTDHIEYMSAKNKHELQENMITFVQKRSKKIILFEVFTDREINAEVLKHYYKNI